MEDLENLYDKAQAFMKELKSFSNQCLADYQRKLNEYSTVKSEFPDKTNVIQTPSPQQIKKRAKCLSTLEEEVVEKNITKLKTIVKSNSSIHSNESLELQNIAKTKAPIPAPRSNAVQNDNDKNFEEKNLMPPPAAPSNQLTMESDVSSSETSYTSGRPTRAAKLKSAKCLKEPKLNEKLRRPSNFNVIKKEHEQRESQMHLSQNTTRSNRNSDESIVLVPSKPPSMVIVNSDNDEDNQSRTTVSTISSKSQKSQLQQNEIDTDPSEESQTNVRQLRVKIKREKISLEKENDNENNNVDNSNKEVFKQPQPIITSKVNEKQSDKTEDTVADVSSNKSHVSIKKVTKKKIVRPIKVERLSDVDVSASPVASRTRKASYSQNQKGSASGESGTSTEAPPPPSSQVLTQEHRVKKQKSFENKNSGDDVKNSLHSASDYEDAVETEDPTTNEIIKGAANETFDVATANDANQQPLSAAVATAQTTFVVENNLNSTVTLKKHSFDNKAADATFNVEHNTSKNDGQGQRSFETAKDISASNNDSLITEDESVEETPTAKSNNRQLTNMKNAKISKPKITTNPTTMVSSNLIKTHSKFPTNRAKELFNPSLPSPVKMRVEAFESVAASNNNVNGTNSKTLPRLKKKENVGSSSNTTPTIGKLQNPVLKRFLTPTQSTNIPLSNIAGNKKLASSASKVTGPLHKSVSASNLIHSNTTSQLSSANEGGVRRENSADDIRKALLSQAEERKKQREQKNKMVAMAREAKERERAARLEKIKQEREERERERRLKKEQDLEKKRQLHEINRKLREDEEAEAERKKREMDELRKIREQEKIAAAMKLKAKQEQYLKHHQQQQQQQQQEQFMPPPLLPPKHPQNKYTFEMLDECDSTDDEDKTSYKRPPPPTWSRRHVRGTAILMQQHMFTNIIDSFFSVEPMTPDLKTIFPNIDARYLKRNSSALWATPPRYSELPKY